jgi:hypothetical protein
METPTGNTMNAYKGTLVYFRIADGHLYRVHWKPDDATTLPTTRP